MPKHTSLSCKQVQSNNEANNAQIHAAAKSQVEIKRAKKQAKKVAQEAIIEEHNCHCDEEA
jgi:cell division septum initiation protein DivIVA